MATEGNKRSSDMYKYGLEPRILPGKENVFPPLAKWKGEGTTVNF